MIVDFSIGIYGRIIVVADAQFVIVQVRFSTDAQQSKLVVGRSDRNCSLVILLRLEIPVQLHVKLEIFIVLLTK